MRTHSRLLPLLPLAALTIGCVDTRSIEITPELEAVVDGNNGFAVDLYQEVAADENLVFSPISISAALSMTMAGAEGDTRQEMGDTLGVDLADEASWHANFGALMQDLDGRFDGYQVNVANRLFGAEGMDWEPDFLDVNELDYGAALEEMDFVGATERSREKINRWVDKQTSGYIDELIKPGKITAQTALVLTNAIYFEGEWTEAFEADNTSADPFTRADGSESTVDMMRHTAQYGYAALTETELDALLPEGQAGAGVGAMQIARLPYGNDETSLFVALPDDPAGLADVEAALSIEMIDAWDDAIVDQQVRVALPRVTQRSEIDLTETLAAMGMPSAFDPDLADFTGMRADGGLHISFVVHEAFIEVEETGTKAAAATAVGVSLTSAPAEPVEFTADSPFLFFVRDDVTGSILFAGKVVDP